MTFAKSLSDERLATLYQDAKRLLISDPDVYISPVPNEFSDLEPIVMRVWGSEKLGVKLEGCIDHFVFLNIDIASRQIVIRYGEGPTASEDVLWTDDS